MFKYSAKQRRANGSEPWTDAEDHLVLAHTPKEASALLPQRTSAAIRQRRYQLNHKDEYSSEFGLKWTANQVALIKELYPTAERVKDIMHLFPGKSMNQLRSKACVLKVKRKYHGNSDARATGHIELIDQIQVRCKEDGISFKKLDQLLGTKSYFQKGYRGRKVVKMAAILKALDFFNAKLVIDWNDR